MTEILDADYKDGGLLPLFGTELLEANGNRSNFDDVDDHHGRDASPPTTCSRVALANWTGWRHIVAVAFVNSANPVTTSGSDTGVKRITGTIYHGTVVAARLVALSTN